MEIKINIDNHKMKKVIDTLNEGFTNFKPLLKEIGKVQMKSIDETFKTNGKNIGESWTKLKFATTKQKIKIGKNIGTLQRTGKMRKSFFVSKLTGNELEINNKQKYFKYHQIGTKNIPQRQMMGHSREMIKRHEIATIDYILKLIKKGTR